MNKKILVVEDHDLLLLAIRDILEVEGYSVLTAMDGIEALKMMEEVTPDLIVADIMMPRMNGYELFEAVRERPAWVPIPFIFLTAKAEKEDRLKGKAMGAEDYITKPFDPEELVIAVRAKLGRSQAIRVASEREFEDLKQQIITLLSHELRTPLTSVYGYTELALEEAAGMPTPEFQNFLLGIKKGADRLTNLVEDLLLLVRLDTGHVKKEFELLGSVEENLSEIITRATLNHQAIANSKGLKLELDIPEQLPPVRIYEAFVIEILSRLIDNAIKFSRDQGSQITISAQVENGNIAIAVQDEGIGIPESKMNRLFESFGQLDRSKMEQQGGGLGLVIVKGLANLMHGDITVESTVGEGSTFTLTLPVADEE